jgi:hypothetical protein
MKKKVLPPFYQHYSSFEEQLIAHCKKHFMALKQEGLVIIPFAFLVTGKGNVQQLFPRVFEQHTNHSFIEQLQAKGDNYLLGKEASCYAVCYDANVFDEDKIDQDALVILLKKEIGSEQQLNVPYVEAEEGLVYGDEWLG